MQLKLMLNMSHGNFRQSHKYLQIQKQLNDVGEKGKTVEKFMMSLLTRTILFFSLRHLGDQDVFVS